MYVVRKRTTVQPAGQPRAPPAASYALDVGRRRAVEAAPRVERRRVPKARSAVGARGLEDAAQHVVLRLAEIGGRVVVELVAHHHVLDQVG